MTTNTLQQRMDDLFTDLIRKSPEGARFRDLQARVEQAIPGVNYNTLRGAIYRYGHNLPEGIIRPVRGLYITQQAWARRDKSKAVPTTAYPYWRK